MSSYAIVPTLAASCVEPLRYLSTSSKLDGDRKTARAAWGFVPMLPGGLIPSKVFTEPAVTTSVFNDVGLPNLTPSTMYVNIKNVAITRPIWLEHLESTPHHYIYITTTILTLWSAPRQTTSPIFIPDLPTKVLPRTSHKNHGWEWVCRYRCLMLPPAGRSTFGACQSPRPRSHNVSFSISSIHVGVGVPAHVNQ
jgi:hypothetical protein